MTVMRLITQPYKMDVTLVVGGWNLLNILLAGCALGVVSERGERQSSRRVSVRRRCEVIAGESVLAGIIENVSSHGARIRIPQATAEISRPDRIEVRIAPLSPMSADPILPCMVRHAVSSEGSADLGVRYLATTAVHYQIVADLLYGNSDQWTEMQAARRINPGLLRGTIWFWGLGIRETLRGLRNFAGAPRGHARPALQGEREAEVSR